MDISHIILIFFATIFLHIYDDFKSQGILASMKQKEWWESQSGYNLKYEYNYTIALLAHSFSWAAAISIPSLVYYYIINKEICLPLLFFIITQTMVHCIIDDLKANEHKINLIQDQLAHIIQIIIEIIILISLI